MRRGANAEWEEMTKIKPSNQFSSNFGFDLILKRTNKLGSKGEILRKT